MAEMPNVQTQRFDFPNEGASLLNSVYLGNLVQPINDFDRKLAVRRIGDVLLLHRRVNMNRVFQRHLAMQTNAHLEYAFNTFSTDALAKMHQLRTMAGQFALKFPHAAKCLVVWIALPLQYHCFITQVLQLLQYQQSNHQADRLTGRT